MRNPSSVLATMKVSVCARSCLLANSFSFIAVFLLSVGLLVVVLAFGKRVFQNLVDPRGHGYACVPGCLIDAGNEVLADFRAVHGMPPLCGFWLSKNDSSTSLDRGALIQKGDKFARRR